MFHKYYKNLITTILISSFLLMPLASLPKKTEAASIGGYISGLAPAIVQLPLCQGKIKAETAALFGGKGAALAATKAAADATKAAKNAVIAKASAAAFAQATSIQTFDPVVYEEVNKQSVKLDSIDASTSSLDSNDACLRNIGQLVIKMLLQKLTVSTVNWINSGFDGKPAYLQDPGKFFKDIAKNEIVQFGLEINNSELFPFGKEWLKNQALAYNNKFADNSRYSLNELIQKTSPQYSAASFQVDFSQGGWDAWDAMTQVPANNSLGFQLAASDELSKRLQGTSNSVAQNVQDALKQANGFLGDNRCMAPEGLTKQQDAENKIIRAKIGPKPNILKYYTQTGLKGGIVLTPEGQAKYDAELADWQDLIDNDPICTDWQYVTPGALIAKAATDAVGYPKDSLLKADDLNSAVAAILDALLARFSTTIMQKGFAALGTEGADGSFITDPSSVNTDGSQTLKDYTPVQLATSWLSANPDFNIRTDLTQALIDEQRTYSDKLKEQNKELNSTTDGRDYAMVGSWTECAKENKVCTFVGTKQVRYGEYGNYFYKTATSSISCSNATFGDPLKTIRKSCYYRPVPTTTIETSNAYGLIPTINQLDYCVPGPHSGWEDNTRDNLSAATGVIIPESIATIKNYTKDQLLQAGSSIAVLAGTAVGAKIGASIGTGVLPGPGTAIGAAIGAIAGTLIGFGLKLVLGDDDPGKLRAYYSIQIQSLTGVATDYPNNEAKTASNLLSKQGAVQAMNQMLDRYDALMKLVYSPKVLPSVYKETDSEYDKLPGYYQIMANNDNAIFNTKDVIATLGKIKSDVEKLNIQRDGNSFSSNPSENDRIYEEKLKQDIDAFGRVSANMVNGDDIAGADSLLKQIIDEKTYVYADLLKGKYGCEQELADPQSPLPDQLYKTQRMDYPFPILYTYNIPAGGNIPDPYQDISKLVSPNQTSSKATFPAPYGPGFLSYYTFQQQGDTGPTRCVADASGAVAKCEIGIVDILPLGNNNGGGSGWTVHSLGSTSDITSGPFEHTIGIY